MKEIEKLVSEIENLTHGYKPSEATAKALSEKTVVTIIGPFGVGKSTLMHKVAEVTDDYSYVLGFTTRPKRSGEAEGIYRYIDHNAERLSQLRNQLQGRDLVQVAINPVTKFVYGSDLESYSNVFNILDVYASVIDEFETLPFKAVRNVYVVASPSDWKSWLTERETMQTKDDIQKRWKEAKINLEWGLQNQDRISWVVNSDGNLEQAYDQIIRIGRGETLSDARGPEFAKAMLSEVEQQLRVKL